MLYALCNDRTTPAFQAGLFPPSYIISAFCGLGNHMLRGKIKEIGCDLLVDAQLTRVDKPNGRSRPIRIECACRRWFRAAACKVLSGLLAALVMVQKSAHGCVVFLQRKGFSIMSVDIENAFNRHTLSRYL